MTEQEKEERRIQLIQNKKNRKERSEQEWQKKRQRIAFTVMILLVLAGLSHSFWDRSFHTFEEITSTPNSGANYTQFIAYQDGYLKYSQDGISCLTQAEKVLWTEAYNMSNPAISVEGEYAAVADLEGNEVLLFDEGGKVGEYSMPYPVKKVQVASQGVFCVVLEEGTDNYIRLYNKEGSLLADIKSKLESNGYPLAVAISSDGKKMVASYYCVDGIDSKNVLSFYNFGEGGKGQSGNLVGTYQFDHTFIPKIEFMDDRTVCAVGDDQTIFYQMKDKPKKVKTLSFNKEIKSVFSNHQYIGYIFENDSEGVEAGTEQPYQMMIYNKSGHLKASIGRNKLYESVKWGENVIISYTGSECSLLRMNGTEFFCQNLGDNIVDVLPTAKRTEYMVIYSDRSTRIKLKNKIQLKTEKTEQEEES
ncbi:MAG: DUF5711 family protein [Lachnospiraceae bacterium]|nr:DUF5711 family protein [Lachnospiraceae bacterium]